MAMSLIDAFRELISLPERELFSKYRVYPSIWSNTELTHSDLVDLVEHATGVLQKATQLQLEALETETAKVRLMVDNELDSENAMRRGSIDTLKGNICVLIEKRLVSEETTKRMAEGHHPNAASGASA